MKDKLRGHFLGLFVLLVVFLIVAWPVLAMQTPVIPAPPPVSTLATNVAIVAGIVASVLQGLKKMIPQINGKVAIILSIVLALATTYAAAPPASVTSVQFLLTSLSAALGANGIYSLLKKPQIEPNPGDGPAANKLNT